ncbi:MAG: camphor resistance protein CrcB [Sphingomonadales bacterium RIFCSPHIGHO2_01_FULL_65_20]|jgi:CrcB protein|uniref:fluoride efflux transporter CrcB n=1 Tax=unclassified Blastomonas TaxID=2626550 RepID=UPI00082EDA3F|nr:fluoride efflux transporter CrcB [Blastomonas sp.]MCH2236938.1 fluoride efflux transporter CrcB [Blastomonas sp.]OHC91848.1 MAG: camphor resistance protein CrcB [Sphingomonadales bacterium RIFCSPHIGHO2_01_FULL_65_20]
MDAHLTFKATGLVMAGGAIGAALRFQATQLAIRLGHTAYPAATLSVNVLGGLLMGVLAALVLKGQMAEPVRLFLGVGVLGGFTTFSAFSLELFQMLERGAALTALGYALTSVLLSLAAVAAGFVVTRSIA